MKEVELEAEEPAPFEVAFEAYLEEEEENFRFDMYDGDYLERKYRQLMGKSDKEVHISVEKKEATHVRLEIIVALFLLAKFTVFPGMPWWVLALPLFPFVIIAIPILGAMVGAAVLGGVIAVTHVWKWAEGVWGNFGWVKRRRDRKREEARAALRVKRGQQR